MAEFDLDNPPPEPVESPAARRRRERREKGEQEKPASKASVSKSESDLRGKLSDAFGKLADQMRKRGDDELADALADEKDVMSNSLVGLTRTVKWLRRPLVLFLAVLEPVLAFWRVGGILIGRVFRFRDAMLAEREQMAAEQAVTFEQPIYESSPVA